MPYKITNPNRAAAFRGVIVIIIIAGIIFGAIKFFKNNSTGDPYDNLTLSEAAKMGETQTYKLMIQIETPKGLPEDTEGRYERGDIVLILPADHGFSPAEKEGFLIIKMDLTQKQTELLTRSLEEIKNPPTGGKNKETGEPERETLKRRKYTVDLTKIGIAPDDQKGREITDKTFEWEDVVAEKEK